MIVPVRPLPARQWTIATFSIFSDHLQQYFREVVTCPHIFEREYEELVNGGPPNHKKLPLS